jgi:hypothetical protein
MSSNRISLEPMFPAQVFYALGIDVQQRGSL